MPALSQDSGTLSNQAFTPASFPGEGLCSGSLRPPSCSETRICSSGAHDHPELLTDLQILQAAAFTARRGDRDDQLLPVLGADLPQARRSGALPDQGADPGHLWGGRGKDHAGLLPALASIDSRKVTITSRRELGMAQVYRMLRVAPSDEGVLGV
jgi:hypothetical protein